MNTDTQAPAVVPYANVRRVKAVTDDRVADLYLTAGWKLLNIETRRDEEDYSRYVLGWALDADPVFPKRQSLF